MDDGGVHSRGGYFCFCFCSYFKNKNLVSARSTLKISIPSGKALSSYPFAIVLVYWMGFASCHGKATR